MDTLPISSVSTQLSLFNITTIYTSLSESSSITDRPRNNGNNNNTDLRQEISQYVPLVAYSLLTLISGIRLWTHRIRGFCNNIRSSSICFCCCRNKKRTNFLNTNHHNGIPSAKFAFHAFLFIFAVGKTIATALNLDISALNNNGEGSLAALIMNSLSGCSYISLLLFLETHWRDILRPLEVIKVKNYAKVMATFIMLNITLYAFIAAVVYIEWVRNNGQVGSMFWSSDVIDGVLVCIAVSYTSTAVRMYRRIAKSLQIPKPVINNQEIMNNNNNSSIDNIRLKSNIQRPSISDGSLSNKMNTNNNNNDYDSFDDNDVTRNSSNHNQHTTKSSSLFSNFHRNNSNTNLAGERSPLMNRPTASSSSSSTTNYAITNTTNNNHHHSITELSLSNNTNIPPQPTNINESFGGNLRRGFSIIMSSNDIVPPLESNINNNNNTVSSNRNLLNRSISLGIDNIDIYNSTSITPRLYAVDGNGQQLRDALAVFITIMLSSAALLCIRTGLSLAFSGSVQNQWWYQLFVVWLPDVPPCCAYMILMWPRDDDKRLAASSKSQLGQLFTKLLDEEDNYYDNDHTNLFLDTNNQTNLHDRGISSNLNSPLLAGLNRSSISDGIIDSPNTPINNTNNNWLENLVLKRNISSATSNRSNGVADSITSPLSTGTGTYQAPALLLGNETKVNKSLSSSPLLTSTPNKRIRGSSLVGRVMDAAVSALQMRKSTSNISLDKLSNVSGDSLGREDDDRSSNNNDRDQGIELPLTLRLPSDSPVPITLVGMNINKLIKTTNGFTIPCAEMRPLPSQASSLVRVSILTFSCSKVRAPPRHLLLRQALRKQQYNRVQRMRRHVNNFTNTNANTLPLTNNSIGGIMYPNNKFISHGREQSSSTTGSGTDENIDEDDDRYSFELEEDELLQDQQNKKSSSQPVPIKSRSFYPSLSTNNNQPQPSNAVNILETIPSESSDSYLGTTLNSSNMDDDMAATYASSYIPQSLLSRTGKSKRHTVRSRVLRIASDNGAVVGNNNVTNHAHSLSTSVSVGPTHLPNNTFTSPRLGTSIPTSSPPSIMGTSVNTNNTSVPPTPFHIHIPMNRNNSVLAPATPLFLPSTPFAVPTNVPVSISGRNNQSRRLSNSSNESSVESDNGMVDTNPNLDQHTQPTKLSLSTDNEKGVEPMNIEPITIRNGSLVTIITADSLLNRGAYLSYLQSWLEYECYIVVCVGLRATRIRTKSVVPSSSIKSTTNVSTDATTLAINHILSHPQNNHTNGSVLAWRYIGHTEPAYLEDETGFISGISNGNDTTPTDFMRMGVTLVDGEPVLSCGVGFGMSIPVPHSLISDAQEAAIALTKDSEISNTSNEYGTNIRFDALVRFQLRWYDGEDEDRQMRIGRLTNPNISTTKKSKNHRHHRSKDKNPLIKTEELTSPTTISTDNNEPASRMKQRRSSKGSVSGINYIQNNVGSRSMNNLPYIPGGLIVPPTNAFADLAAEVCTTLAVKEEEYHQQQIVKQQQLLAQQKASLGRSRRGSSTGGASTSSNRSSRAASVAEALAILETGMGERSNTDAIHHDEDNNQQHMNDNHISNTEEDLFDGNIDSKGNRDTGRSRGASVFSMLLGGGFTNTANNNVNYDENPASSRFATDKSAEDEYLLASWTIDAESILSTMNNPGRVHVEEDNPLFTLSEQEQKAVLKSRVHIHGQTDNDNNGNINTNMDNIYIDSSITNTSTNSKSRRGSTNNVKNVSSTSLPNSSPTTKTTNNTSTTVMDDHHESLAFAIDDGTRTRLTVQVERIVSIRPGADLLVPGLYAIGENAYIHKNNNQQLTADINDDDDDEDIYEETDKYADHQQHNPKSTKTNNHDISTNSSLNTSNDTEDPDYDDDAASVASLMSGASNMDNDNDEDSESNEEEKVTDQQPNEKSNNLIQQATRVITKEISSLGLVASKLSSEISSGIHSEHKQLNVSTAVPPTGNIHSSSSSHTTDHQNKGHITDVHTTDSKFKKKNLKSWLFGKSNKKSTTNDDLENLKLGTKGARSRITAAVLPPSNRRLDLACYSYSLELTVNANAISSSTNKNTVRSPITVNTPKRINTVQNLNSNINTSTPPVSSSGLFRAATSPFRMNPTFQDTIKPLDTAIPNISTELRISVVEATAESAYTAIVPRVLLPLILARRLTNLVQARNALERYLIAYTQGGNYGSTTSSHDGITRSSSNKSKDEDIVVHVGPDGSRMRSLPPPPMPKSSPLSLVSSVYGRLVGHIEREEEAKEGLNWLRNRVLYLHAYCADIAATLQGVLGLVPARDGVKHGADALPTMNSFALLGIPAALTAAVHTTLIAAAAAFAGPALALSDNIAAHDAANLGDGMGEESAALAMQLEGGNIAAATAAAAAIAGTPISTFRASTRKKDAAVRWLPTNLHTQILNMTASLSLPDSADATVLLSSFHSTSHTGSSSTIYNQVKSISTDSSNNLTMVPCQPIATASESLVTVGAPTAHIYEFSNGGGMGHKISKLQSIALSPSLSNGRELAVNAARRDLEDAKLSLKIRADAVIVQAISAVTSAVASNIQKALDTATAGPVAAALVYLNNGHSCMESLPNPTQNAMRAWLRLAHESNEGMAAIRQWLALGMLIAWESLLSCVGKERGMLDDMRFGAAIAGNVRYALIDAADAGALEVVSGGSDVPANSLSVEPDIFTESAAKFSVKRNKNNKTKLSKNNSSPELFRGNAGHSNSSFYFGNESSNNGMTTPDLPDNKDAFAENKLDDDMDYRMNNDDDIDSPLLTSNADTTLRPVVLGTAIRVIPSGIFQSTITTLGCHNHYKNQTNTSSFDNDNEEDENNNIFINMTNTSGTSSSSSNFSQASTSEGLVFIIPIAGLRASIRAGLLPRSLLPVPGSPWPLITACPILLTQGINEMQQAAYFMGTTYLQSVINMDAIHALQHYVRAYLSHANNETLRLQAAAAEVTAAIQLARTTANNNSNQPIVNSLQNHNNNNSNNNNSIPTPILDGPLGGINDTEICGRLYIEYLQHSMNTNGLSPGSSNNTANNLTKVMNKNSTQKSKKFKGRFLSSTNEDEDTYFNTKQNQQLPTLSELGIIDWWGRERKLTIADQAWVPGQSATNKRNNNNNKNNDSTAVTTAPPITMARIASSSSALPEEVRWLAAATLAAQQSLKMNDDNNYLSSTSSTSLSQLNTITNQSQNNIHNLRTVPIVSIQDLPLQPPKLAPLSDRAQLAATVLTALRSALFGLTSTSSTNTNTNNSSTNKNNNSGSIRSSVSSSKLLSSDTSNTISPSTVVYGSSPLHQSYSVSNNNNPSSSSSSPAATTNAVLNAAITGDTESEEAAILRLFEDITRILRGTRLTSCKSAKDRTGMAVTLEEARLLAQFETSTITSISTTLHHLTTTSNNTAWLLKKQNNNDNNNNLYSLSQLQIFTTVGQYGPHVPATDLPGKESLTLVSRIPISLLQLQWLQNFDNIKASWPPGLSLAAGTGDLNCLINKLPSTMPIMVSNITAFLLHPLIYNQLIMIQQQQQQQTSVSNPNRTPITTSNNDNTSSTTLLPSVDIQLQRPYDTVVSDIVGMANFLREYGTRLGNAEKNTGTYAFAFSAFQRAFFPAEYRAPTSVIGARIT